MNCVCLLTIRTLDLFFSENIDSLCQSYICMFRTYLHVLQIDVLGINFCDVPEFDARFVIFIGSSVEKSYFPVRLTLLP